MSRNTMNSVFDVLSAERGRGEYRKQFPHSFPMKFEYWKSKHNNQWYWHLRGENGERVAQGEGYMTKIACLEIIQLVKCSATAPDMNLTPAQN